MTEPQEDVQKHIGQSAEGARQLHVQVDRLVTVYEAGRRPASLLHILRPKPL